MLSTEAIGNTVRKVLKRVPVALVDAPTGSGKSTLIPVAIYWELKKQNPNVKVIVIVPTRIAALSLARRVGEQNKGVIVDSMFRGKKSNSEAKLIYSTPHYILAQYIKCLRKHGGNPSDFPWDYVVVDEVHTASLENSLIFSFHSAMNSSGMKLGMCLLSSTPGPIYAFPNVYDERIIPAVTPIVRKHLLNEATEYRLTTPLRKTLHLDMAEQILELHKDSNRYTILVFVDGIRMLNALYKELLIKIKSEKITKIELLKSYGGASRDEMDNIMKRPKRDAKNRRVIIATNVSESSITIPNVGYVVDSMLEKRPSHGIVGSKSTLVVNYISLSSSIQRKGRAAREPDVYMKRYYPMVTANIYEEQIANHPFKEPEIKIVALERVALVLMSRGFRIRAILQEASDNRISETIINLMKYGCISVNFTLPKNTPDKNELPEIAIKYLNKIKEGQSLDDIEKTKVIKDLCPKGYATEVFNLTDFGEFWLQFPSGLLPVLLLWRWIKSGRKNVLMVALVAALMDIDIEKVFPEEGNKFMVYNEKFPKYMSKDPLTTLLCVFYNLCIDQPEILSLHFDAQKVALWCGKFGLGASVIIQTLNLWKTIVTQLYSYGGLDIRSSQEIHEVIAGIIDCLDTKDEAFFLNKAGSYYNRKNSTIPCSIDRNSVPYYHYSIPKNVYFLNIIEAKSNEDIYGTRQLETVSLFLPRVYIRDNHYKPDFLIGAADPAREIYLKEEEESIFVRFPLVSPEDVGLRSESFVIPSALNVPKIQYPPGAIIPTRKHKYVPRYPQCIYPIFLNFEGFKKQEQPEIPIEEDIDIDLYYADLELQINEIEEDEVYEHDVDNMFSLAPYMEQSFKIVTEGRFARNTDDIDLLEGFASYY